MLLVKIFLIRLSCEIKTTTSQGLIFVQSDLSLVVFHCQDSANSEKPNNKVCFEKTCKAFRFWNFLLEKVLESHGKVLEFHIE